MQKELQENKSSIITVNVPKFWTPKKKKKKKKEHPKFIFSPHQWSKGTGASFYTTGYFPHRIFGIFLFGIKFLLYKFLEHLPYPYC